MNELTLQNAVFRWCCNNNFSIVVPNYHYVYGGEADLMGVERKKLLVEFEIKCSVSDFRNDAKAKSPKHFKLNQLYDKKSTANGMPSRFYFVVTHLIAEKIAAEVPPWAGLIVFTPPSRPGGPYYGDPDPCIVFKTAPRLHEVGATDNQLHRLVKAMMWRCWKAKDDLRQTRDSVKVKA